MKSEDEIRERVEKLEENKELMLQSPLKRDFKVALTELKWVLKDPEIR